VKLLPLDNAVLKFKDNALLTLILMCATSNDLNPVDCVIWGALQQMVCHYGSFKSVQELKSAIMAQRCNNCHKCFLYEVSVNVDVVFKT